MTTRNENVPPVEAYGDPFETLDRCKGIYNPVDRFGKYLGPPVASGQEVVKEYYNFGMAIQYPHILAHWAQLLTSLINKHEIKNETLYVGMPKWGHFLALQLARNAAFGISPRYPRVIPAEKKIKITDSGCCPEEHSFSVQNHRIHDGDQVIIVKDIGRHFKATAGLVRQIVALDAQVIAIVCVCACSLEDHFQGIPIIALSRRNIPLFDRNHPSIVAAVKRYGIVLDPEERWGELMEIMLHAKK